MSDDGGTQSVQNNVQLWRNWETVVVAVVGKLRMLQEEMRGNLANPLFSSIACSVNIVERRRRGQTGKWDVGNGTHDYKYMQE